MSEAPVRLLVLGAHPDDAEFQAGGLITAYRRAGRSVKVVSVTNGAAGHHQMTPPELARRRQAEGAEVARRFGIEYAIWDFPDGALLPTLEVRARIIREIREYAPHLVLTHRTCDYHPDHRAVGLAVQDASYMVTVPHVVPEVPALREDPVVAYMNDLFTKPCPFQPDIIFDISSAVEDIVDMLACHESQVFEWLPYNLRLDATFPVNPAERRAWLKEWYGQRARSIADRFRPALREALGDVGAETVAAEAYEISEYAGKLHPALRRRLFEV